MFQIAICDDEEKQRKYVLELLGAWAKLGRHLLEIKEFPNAESFLFQYETEKDFDILLLDVEMEKLSGIDLAKEVRKENKAVQIVFITGYYEYFSDGFDVSALHYLIKPVDERKLYPVLDRAVSNLSSRERSVLLSTADADIGVPLADILYVESENVYVVVHTVSETYRSRMPLSKFMQQLDDTFYQVHRSFVVGLRYVKKVSRSEVTMQNGDAVPIRRGSYDEVHAALIRHL